MSDMVSLASHQYRSIPGGSYGKCQLSPVCPYDAREVADGTNRQRFHDQCQYECPPLQSLKESRGLSMFVSGRRSVNNMSTVQIGVKTPNSKNDLEMK
ncbi:hypothetical protein JOB18_005494 [Solea senegalensis]|uniref:Uncharacterized protein n=1 Tax=Solea senegalensis TaxID=28829 RepID=A0AAV6PPE0_SOLSE|nr:hypothetical protein JOB18_005494 [Solea senegalensis]